MVWDGDQMLYEIAAPGGSTASAAVMERDTALATPFRTGGYFYQTGRVEYVHGPGIDQPLRFYRGEYSDSIPDASFIPQANWRGVYDMGVRSGGCYERTWTKNATTPQEEGQTGSDTTSTITSGTETLCADVEWPAQYTWAHHQYRKGYHGPYNWMGSLAFGMRDASGLHYRRNRFYDAEQGRFTQEDPIGLAGGINLYGFANGDPVTYSDPYGLCPENVCPLDFGGGYRGRVDHYTENGVAKHEIHVYRVNSAGVGREVGVFGQDGWVARHGFDGSDPGVPRAALAKINGQNVTELRRLGTIRPRGQQDIAGGAYSPRVAALFRRANSVAAVFDVSAVAGYQGQAKSLGLNYWTYAGLRMVGISHEEIAAKVSISRPTYE